MKFLPSLLLLLVAAVPGRAQFTISVNMTANATAGGFTAGQAASLTFTVTGADTSANVGNRYFSYVNEWWDDITADTPLFTAVSGTGLTGSLARPAANVNDPFSYIQALPSTPPPSNFLTLFVGAETSNVGLQLNGQTVSYLLAGILDWGQNFPTPSTYTDLTTFFSPYSGTHALNPASGGYVDIALTNGSLLHFTPSTISITPIVAIPEPATPALLASGTLLLAAGALRRKRRPAERTV